MIKPTMTKPLKSEAIFNCLDDQSFNYLRVMDRIAEMYNALFRGTGRLDMPAGSVFKVNLEYDPDFYNNSRTATKIRPEFDPNGRKVYEMKIKWRAYTDDRHEIDSYNLLSVLRVKYPELKSENRFVTLGPEAIPYLEGIIHSEEALQCQYKPGSSGKVADDARLLISAIGRHGKIVVTAGY